jgi:two-component system, chemotaxis family, response regulator Rcp1
MPEFASVRSLEILLAEDNEFDVHLTEAAFRDAIVPNRVNWVSDGEAAISFLKRAGEHSHAPRPDLILLDLNLPKMDGFQVLEAIKADPQLKNIPVIVVSGSNREADIARAYELQASAYVVKPLEVDEYFAAIRSLKQLWFHAASPAPKPDSAD